MEFVRLFFVRYFIVLCVGVILVITSIQRYKQHKRTSICMLIITGLAFLLSIANIIEEYAKASANVPLATICAFLGYVLRPTCLYTFILMSDVVLNKKTFILSSLPLVVNALIFALAFIPGVKSYVYFFSVNESGTLSFGGGFLKYTAHVIAFAYLIWLLIISISKLRAKYFTGSLSLFACALFVIIAVLVETFANDNGDVFLLNSTIVISALQYYLFLYTEKAQIDSLTGLFNRETYYHDLQKMEKTISAVVQFDMNGLKYINDNFGHHEGDKALQTISRIIKKHLVRGMYVYRVGGDEFIILANGNSEMQIKDVISQFAIELEETDYYCSFGYAIRKTKTIPVEEVIKEAEQKMYQAKAAFYKHAPFERRKR